MTAAPQLSPVLEMRDIVQRFGPVQVLHGVHFDVRPGEVHALLGENGAGKSTLMKILAGVHPPTAGQITLSGAPAHFRSVADASRHGVRMLFQELSLAPDLSVEENLHLGQMPGLVQDGRLRRDVQAHLAQLGVKLPLGRPVRDLSVGERQMTAIARALLGDARVLVFDEPTAPLTAHETEQLFEFIAGLRTRGLGVVYISHHLDEVFRVADRVTVLRDGRTVATAAVRDTSKAQVIEWMVGRNVQVAARARPAQGDVHTRVQVRPHGQPPGTLELRPGEIVGLVGIIGSGRTEFCRALVGVRGCSTWSGPHGVREITRLPQALAARIGFVPEDRKHEGAVLDTSIGENLSLSSLAQVSRAGILNTRAERDLTRHWIGALRVRPADPTYQTGALSGGNQQKVVLGRVLATRPEVLILEEPTRGVDIGAREDIYAVIADLAAAGMPVVLSSGDAAEVVGLASRILVFHGGQVTHELHAPITLEEVIAHVTGTV